MEIESDVHLKLTRRTVLSSLTVALLLAGCAIPHVPSRIVYEDPVNYVRLEIDKTVLPEWPQGHFSHPAMLGKEVLRAVLSGLKVQEHRIAPQQWIQGVAPVVPAFDEDEVALLSVQLAEGLAQAEYNERVTFYLSQPLTFFRRMITTGGIYLRGKELHIILGNWKIIYGIPAYGMIYDRRYPMRPTAAKGFDLLFEPADAVIWQKSSLLDDLLANTKDELVIDIGKLELPAPMPGSVSPNVFNLAGQRDQLGYQDIICESDLPKRHARHFFQRLEDRGPAELAMAVNPVAKPNGDFTDLRLELKRPPHHFHLKNISFRFESGRIYFGQEFMAEATKSSGPVVNL